MLWICPSHDYQSAQVVVLVCFLQPQGSKLTNPSMVQMSFGETAGNVESRRRLTLEPFLQAQLASEEVADADNWGPPGESLE